MPARAIIEAIVEGEIKFGWVRGGHVVFGDYQEGEDSHHISQQRNKLPDDDSEWKRWRYNSALRTVFWWEAPTVEERDAVGAELGTRQHVFVNLRSSPQGARDAAHKLMPTDDLQDMEQSDDESRARAGSDLLDVVHYPDRPSDYIERWLRTVGD